MGVAVVTGVTSGIGKALCASLASAGWQIFGIGRDEARMHAAAKECGFVPIVADLAEGPAVAAAAAEIARRSERLDALVNNAAFCVYDSPLGLDDARWQQLLDVNVLAAIRLTSALAPRLAGGRIVNVSSVVTEFLPAAKFGPYAVSKAALDQWTAALRLELAGQGTHVSLVSPGLVDTPIYDKVDGFAATLKKLRETVPVWLSAADVAAAIRYTLELPPHLGVAELTLLPRGQAR
jgi:NAD(P)-dependent dehydrogenase (short-subunit alcohol dehydrogenase family)